MDTPSYPPASRPLRLGFVGGGRGSLVASWHATGARLSGRWQIVAGALSSQADVALESGKDWGFAEERIYTDYRTMAREEAARADGIDAVTICTPNASHAAIAEVFIQAGIDVICDKPLCNTLEDAEKMVALQRDSGLVLALTYPYIYHATLRQARDLVRDGAIGDIRQLHVEYLQEWSTVADPDFKGAKWRRDPNIVGRTSAVGDIGTHAFNLAEFVCAQSVSALRADFHVCGGDKPMEDTAFIQMKLSNGAPGSMWISQAAPGNYCGLRLRIYGQKGGIEWDQERPEYLQLNLIGQARQTIVRGAGAGMYGGALRLAHLPTGHAEALSDAWGNLYTECAVAIDARRQGLPVPYADLQLPDAQIGAAGVKFIHAAADSHEAGGVWTPCPH